MDIRQLNKVNKSLNCHGTKVTANSDRLPSPVIQLLYTTMGHLASHWTTVYKFPFMYLYRVQAKQSCMPFVRVLHPEWDAKAASYPADTMTTVLHR